MSDEQMIQALVARLTDSGMGGPLGRARKTKRVAWVVGLVEAIRKAGYEIVPKPLSGVDVGEQVDQ